MLNVIILNRKSFQENRYTTYQTSAPTSTAPVKFRAEDMASQNKYVTHYPTTSSTHLQYYNAPSNQQQQDNQKTSYITTTAMPSSVTTASELSQDITSLLLKEQGGSDSTKRVLQSSSVADYLSHLPTSLSLHHFLKYSADAAIKKESVVVVGWLFLELFQDYILQAFKILWIILGSAIAVEFITIDIDREYHPTNSTNPGGDSQRAIESAKRSDDDQKEEKEESAEGEETETKSRRDKIEVRIGWIDAVCMSGVSSRISWEVIKITFLNVIFCGKFLRRFWNWKCNFLILKMYREILDQHMIGHQNMERRFVCEICNAALKRKDHLTRHKQSHNPERPYLCHCLKAFKRKEQLSLHAVIHSGHKKHSCVECGKGLFSFTIL